MPETVDKFETKLREGRALSIVVIGRNEGQRLARCLESLRGLSNIAQPQVIYVDSDSTDGSAELAAGYGAEVVVVHPERPTAALGRNAGWRLATADHVLFLDGDTVVHTDFPDAAFLALAEDPAIAAVWGHRREIHPETSVYNRVLDLDWVYAPGFTEYCGGDVLMRRQALLDVDGFDERLIAGEEPELCRRMRARGYTVLHIDRPMTGHDLQMTRWGQYWKRATRAGHAYAEVSDRFRGSKDPLWASVRKGNLVRGGFWIASFVLAIATSVWLSAWAIVAWLALAAALSLRSAWKARWKSHDAMVLLLYGIHSHLQQVPIFIGQVQYEIDKRRGRRRNLIDYKKV